MYDNDTSSHNVVTRNIIKPFGSECFNIKENAHDNVFEDNVCSGQRRVRGEFEGSNVELRGYGNIVRNNQISDSAGYTIKIQNDGEGVRPRRQRRREQPALRRGGRDLKIKSKATQGQFCGNNVVASGALFDADSEGAAPAGVTSPC